MKNFSVQIIQALGLLILILALFYGVTDNLEREKCKEIGIATKLETYYVRYSGCYTTYDEVTRKAELTENTILLRKIN